MKKLRQLFSPQRGNSFDSSAESTEFLKSEITDQPTSKILQLAIEKLVDGTVPKPKSARRQLSLFFRSLNKKLLPRSQMTSIPSGAGAVCGYDTTIQGIFKHSGADNFSVSVAPGVAVVRSRSEVATHVALQSYLKHQFGDPSIGDDQVISARDLQPVHEQRSSANSIPESSCPQPSASETGQRPAPRQIAANVQAGTGASPSPMTPEVLGTCAVPVTPAAPITPAIPPAAEAPVTPAAAANQNPDRLSKAEAISSLTCILSRNAVQQANRILEISNLHGGGFPASGPYRVELNQLTADAGENLRLLRDLRSVEAPARPAVAAVANESIRRAIGVLQDDAARAAQRGARGVDRHDPSSPARAARGMGEITSEVVNAVGAANNEFERCSWARQHAIVAVKNGGEEAAPGENEGNNCLLVSILQHATGNYADRFHASMTKTLREAIVAKYPSIHYSDPLHDDTEAIEWLRQTVNALYDRDLQFVSVMMAPAAKVADVVPFISHTSHGGSEPALIWAKGTHYEALVSSASAPAPERPSQLQQLEQRTGAVQIRLQEASGPAAMNDMVADLNQCLRNEMIEIRNLIQAGSRSVMSYSSASIDATAFDGRPASNSSPDAVRRVLNQIGGSHSQALQRKANAELESRFAEKIQCHKLSIPDQYHHLLAVESEFRERPQPGASWSSLVP